MSAGHRRRGRAWVFGDGIDTDVLAPGPYMRKSLPELASHCLEAIEPRFAREVAPGDIVIAGHGFGIGSSREQAVQALVHLGVGALVGRSFARIFYRNALNLGLPALTCPGIAAATGDLIEIDVAAGVVTNLTRSATFQCEPIPPELLRIVDAGGLLPWLQTRLAAERAAKAAAEHGR